MLCTSGELMSSCNGWYGWSVTEFLAPGTRSSERSEPPNIFVTGVSIVMSPEDLVTEAFCFGPTSSQPLAVEVADFSLVGEIGSCSEGDVGRVSRT